MTVWSAESFDHIDEFAINLPYEMITALGGTDSLESIDLIEELKMGIAGWSKSDLYEFLVGNGQSVCNDPMVNNKISFTQEYIVVWVPAFSALFLEFD